MGLMYGFMQFMKPTGRELTAYEREVAYVLAHPQQNPRKVRVAYDRPVVLENWSDSKGTHPIANVTTGQDLTVFGTLKDGNLLVCYSYNGFEPKAGCEDGAAFVVQPSELQQ
jgi:hypothetical protein